MTGKSYYDVAYDTRLANLLQIMKKYAEEYNKYVEAQSEFELIKHRCMHARLEKEGSQYRCMICKKWMGEL